MSRVGSFAKLRLAAIDHWSWIWEGCSRGVRGHETSVNHGAMGFLLCPSAFWSRLHSYGVKTGRCRLVTPRCWRWFSFVCDGNPGNQSDAYTDANAYSDCHTNSHARCGRTGPRPTAAPASGQHMRGSQQPVGL